MTDEGPEGPLPVAPTAAAEPPGPAPPAAAESPGPAPPVAASPPLPPVRPAGPPPGLRPPLGPEPPRVWPAFVAYFGVLAINMGASFALLVALLLRSGPEILREPQRFMAGLESLALSFGVLTGSLALSAVTRAAVALAAARLSPEGLAARLALGRPAVRIWIVPVMALALLALSEACGGVAGALGLESLGMLAKLRDAVARLSGPQLGVFLAAGGLVVPLGEELFFRGYLQTRFVRRWGPARGIALTSLLFGLMHFDLVQTPAAVAAGAFLGWVAWRSGSVWPAIACHALNNLVGFLQSASYTPGRPSSRSADLVVALVTAALFGLLAIYLHRRAPAPAPPAPAPPGRAPGPRRWLIPGVAGAVVALGLVTFFVGLALPAYREGREGRARFTEAHHDLDEISDGAAWYFEDRRDGGVAAASFPPSVGWTPAQPPCRQYPAGAADWEHPTWRAVDFRLDGPHWYRYRFRASGAGAAATYVVEAEADLECNGLRLRYTHHGRIVKGEVERDQIRGEWR